MLAVTSRALVLQEVSQHADGVDTATLARLTGLHPNTVRFHLHRLIDSQLVAVSRDPDQKPGRPRLFFSAVRVPPPAPDGTPRQPGDDGYALLASVLAKHLAATATDPGEEAEAAGRSWATDRESWDEANPAPSEETSVAAVSALFDELGFAPQLVRDTAGWRILLHQCPFHALAAEHPEIVCRLHLGVLQGAVDRLPRLTQPVLLQPFVTPGLCEAFIPLAALSRSVDESA